MADEAKKAGVIDAIIEKIRYVTPATEQREVKTTVKSNKTQHQTVKRPRIKKRP